MEVDLSVDAVGGVVFSLVWASNVEVVSLVEAGGGVAF